MVSNDISKVLPRAFADWMNMHIYIWKEKQKVLEIRPGELTQMEVGIIISMLATIDLHDLLLLMELHGFSYWVAFDGTARITLL